MFDRGTYGERRKNSPGSRRARWAVAAFALIVSLQCLFGLAGIADNWVAGHNGYNGAAYHQGARNAMRFGLLFPSQYHCDRTIPPPPVKLYTHAPLALHGHVMACLAIFGDHEWAVRLTPAFHGVLALIALLWIVRKRWGEGHALVAGSIYVLLPINHSYANMVNHTTGFIFWSLLAMESYLSWTETRGLAENGAIALAPLRGSPRQRLRLAAFFVCCLVAMQWDWPAYYVMAAIALHWFVVIIRGPSGSARFRDLGVLALFCALVLANFFGFIALVYHAAGTLQGLAATARSRSVEFPGIYGALWEKTIVPDFSMPVLLCGALWLPALFIRLIRRRGQDRDLIPAAFFFAGVAHLLTFKNTALVHAYWPWPLNPFFAVAASSVLLWAGGSLASRARECLEQNASWASGRLAVKAAEVIPLLLVLAIFYFIYLAHTLPLIEKGRQFGGVFVERGYVSIAELILFSKTVRDQTTPDTVIYTHPSLRYQVQMNVSLDRTWRRARRLKAPGKPAAVSAPSVAIGAVTGTDPKDIVAAATRYRYRQYGDHYLVDYRYPGQDIQIYEWEKRPASLYWKFWVNPFEPFRRPTRDLQAERRLWSLIARRPKIVERKRSLPPENAVLR
jgi:4-amino-4-deoxy-L-arabinose transferase-like glycosyltransferase